MTTWAKIALLVGAFLLGIGTGGTVQGWRKDAQLSELELKHSAQRLKESNKYAAALKQERANFFKLEGEFKNLQRDKQKEIDDEKQKTADLAECVRTGKCGLRVNAVCRPAAVAGLPPTGTAVAGPAPVPQLDEAARRDYYALRIAIAEAKASYESCQGALAQ